MQNKLLKIARMGLALAILVFAGALPALAQDCVGLMNKITEEEENEIFRKHEKMMAEIQNAWDVADGDSDKLSEEIGKLDLSDAEADAEKSSRLSKESMWDLEESILEISNPLAGGSISQNTDNTKGGFVDYWENITPEQIKTCLKEGSDINVNVQNMLGRTPLHNTARFNKYPEVIIILLKAGANGKLKDSNGHTAFDWAGYNEGLKGTDAYQALKDAQN